MRRSKCDCPGPHSKLLQQPIDIIQLPLRSFALRPTPPQLLLDRLGALPFSLLRHPHIAGVQSVPLVGSPQRIPPAIILSPSLRMWLWPAGALAVVVRHHHPHRPLGAKRIALAFAGALATAAAELLLQSAPHLARALLQRLDRLLLL